MIITKKDIFVMLYSFVVGGLIFWFILLGDLNYLPDSLNRLSEDVQNIIFYGGSGLYVMIFLGYMIYKTK